jgi:hypothetical protein
MRVSHRDATSSDFACGQDGHRPGRQHRLISAPRKQKKPPMIKFTIFHPTPREPQPRPVHGIPFRGIPPKQPRAPFMSLPVVQEHVRRYLSSTRWTSRYPGPPATTFDGITELCFDDVESIAKVFTSSSYLEVLRPDEGKFPQHRERNSSSLSPPRTTSTPNTPTSERHRRGNAGELRSPLRYDEFSPLDRPPACASITPCQSCGGPVVDVIRTTN